ncbi:MAG: hypothetical protein AAB400_05365 [Patescibacteria group bacterium]
MNPEHHTIIRQLGLKEFEGMKLRLGKYGRITADLELQPTSAARIQRTQEIQAVEQKIKTRGRGDEKSGREELLIDTRGYREARRTLHYVSPTGESFDTEAVLFYKKEGQQITWLKSENRLVVLDVGLYCNRLASTLYNQQGDRPVAYIPMVDDRGAYRGIVTIIEDKKKPKPLIHEPEQKSLPPGFRLSTDTIKTIADRFLVDSRRPIQPGSFIRPIFTNIFDSDDRSTLAGRILCDVYERVIERSGRKDAVPADAGKKSYHAFNTYVPKILTRRHNQGYAPLEYVEDRASGTDAFHLGGSQFGSSFLYYFNKSMARWQHPHDPITRAYLTLDTKDLEKTPIHFTDLCLALYDAGIDFMAKCCTPHAQVKRMDNILFYISEPDREHASAIIKQFMTDRKLGKGHMLAAMPSAQDGLSWAYEPNSYEMRLWQEVSGSSQPASFNIVAAMYALPLYLDRLIVACLRTGDTASAETYRKEVERVRLLFRKYRTIT